LKGRRKGQPEETAFIVQKGKRMRKRAILKKRDRGRPFFSGRAYPSIGIGPKGAEQLAKWHSGGQKMKNLITETMVISFGKEGGDPALARGTITESWKGLMKGAHSLRKQKNGRGKFRKVPVRCARLERERKKILCA